MMNSTTAAKAEELRKKALSKRNLAFLMFKRGKHDKSNKLHMEAAELEAERQKLIMQDRLQRVLDK